MAAKKKDENFQGVLHFTTVGMMLVISIVVGFGIGLYLDRKFGIEPWGVMIGTLIGIAAGFKSLYDMVKKYGFDKEDKKD